MNSGHHFSFHAVDNPESSACILAETGEVLTYSELDRVTNQSAQLFRNMGMSAGDGIVILCQNSPRFYEIIWAAHRAGLYYTPVSWHSTAEELAYIIENSGATAFLASSRFADVAQKARTLLTADVKAFSMFGGIEGFLSLEGLRAEEASTRIFGETSGREMLYTSGTTGRPKGVKFPLSDLPIDHTPNDDLFLLAEGYGEEAVVMAPGPLYHASPLMSTRAMHRFGGAVLVVDKFDARETLEYIQKYSVTHMVCVPTHFLRMLDLDEEIRRSYDVSSVRCIMHTGAPCPVETKRAMIEWFGPVIIEYYGGTERIGGAMIRSEEWLAHPGSIGRVAIGQAYAVDEESWSEIGRASCRERV